MTTAAVPVVESVRAERDERRAFDVQIIGPVDRGRDGHFLDVTQGRQIGSHPYDDPTQGSKIGSDIYDDVTRTR